MDCVRPSLHYAAKSRPSNVLFGLAVCIMASTVEEWSFMAE
ncbi:unnamed protein product [Brassica rapa]|uniref:Uncharacterized protein n=1 Tax=Brassica campestris TaxID=3711 RepID=A0A8D9HJX1_BRACM|nr:unnamed protein product [Brassica rapa]